VTHPLGWELRLGLAPDRTLLESRACRVERDVFDTSDRVARTRDRKRLASSVRARLCDFAAAVMMLAGWMLACGGGADEILKAQSPNCGEVIAHGKASLDGVLTFCRKGVVAGTVTGAEAQESLLTLTVTRAFADEVRADRLSAEQLIRNWMRGWRQESDQRVVTIYIKWGDVEIARGDTSLTGSDTVTIR
jgi:hypothetical protein